MVVTPIHPESEHPAKHRETERREGGSERACARACVRGRVLFSVLWAHTGAAMTSIQPRRPFQTTGSTDLVKRCVTPLFPVTKSITDDSVPAKVPVKQACVASREAKNRAGADLLNPDYISTRQSITRDRIRGNVESRDKENKI